MTSAFWTSMILKGADLYVCYRPRAPEEVWALAMWSEQFWWHLPPQRTSTNGHSDSALWPCIHHNHNSAHLPGMSMKILKWEIQISNEATKYRGEGPSFSYLITLVKYSLAQPFGQKTHSTSFVSWHLSYFSPRCLMLVYLPEKLTPK